MYYPINRTKCCEQLDRRIKADTLDIYMLKDIAEALKTYTRKECNKYMIDHIEKLSCARLWKSGTDTTERWTITGKDRILETSAPDKNGMTVATYREQVDIYPERVAEGLTPVDRFKKAISDRLEGLQESLKQKEGIRRDLSALLDEYEAAAKIVEQIADIKGMWCLRDFVKGIR